MALSPDGHYLVINTLGEHRRLWLRSLDSLQTQALPGTDDGSLPFWSPDSRYIAFFAQDKLLKIPLHLDGTYRFEALCSVLLFGGYPSGPPRSMGGRSPRFPYSSRLLPTAREFE